MTLVIGELMIKIATQVVLLSALAMTMVPRAVAQPAAPRPWDDRPAELYRLCTSCHGPDGKGMANVGAPAIAGLPEWYLEAQLTKFHTSVRGGHVKDINGMRMRPVGLTLSEENRKSIAKYVSAMPRPETPDTVKGNLAKGENTYQVCQACHGVKAEGMQAVNAPPLVGANDWYLLTQLKNFKGKVRGYDPSIDPNGYAMAGIAATLDEEAMLNVVAYINSFKSAPVAK